VKLFYRADGNAEIGTGHLLRGIRIATELSRRGDHRLIFCVRAHPWAVERARSSGLEVVTLPLELSEADEPRRCVTEARRLGCDTAAVDLLDTPDEPNLCAALRDAGLRVITLDDTGSGRLSAHAVVNFLVRDPDPDALARRGVRLYEGPDYATLLPEYTNRNQQPKPIPPVASRLLITMGGGDGAGLAVKVLRALRPQPLLSVAVVVGSAFPHMEALRAAASASPHTVRIEVALASLLPEWETASMAVVAGGLTMHEALVTGTPAIAPSARRSGISHSWQGSLRPKVSCWTWAWAVTPARKLSVRPSPNWPPMPAAASTCRAAASASSMGEGRSEW
jgi:UDP-2,4-diacetamido-2,4,6-trideoxy-beta-L-altropyranose hydrolase